MRKITLSDGKEVTVGPLKGKAVRELSLEPEGKVETVFKTLEFAGFGPEITDEMPFPDVMALNSAVIAETFGTEDEVKN